jgi:FTR1 family protein
MFQTFIVLLRESLESFLIVSMIVAFLKQTSQNNLIPVVYAALASAFICSIGLGCVFIQFEQINKIFDMILHITAAVLVTTMAVQLFYKTKLIEKIQNNLKELKLGDSIRVYFSLFAFVFFMVLREGAESAAIIATITKQTGFGFGLIGAGAGIGLAGLISIMWENIGSKINLSMFFKLTNVIMLGFAVWLWYTAYTEFFINM